MPLGIQLAWEKAVFGVSVHFLPRQNMVAETKKVWLQCNSYNSEVK